MIRFSLKHNLNTGINYVGELLRVTMFFFVKTHIKYERSNESDTQVACYCLLMGAERVTKHKQGIG
jgi:hypothetical protein